MHSMMNDGYWMPKEIEESPSITAASTVTTATSPSNTTPDRRFDSSEGVLLPVEEAAVIPKCLSCQPSGLSPQQPHVHVGGLTDASLGHVYDALAMIEPDQKRGWELAQQRCSPAVLQREACPCYFLRACHSNPWDAASRLCSYWTERIDLFGEDKAFEALSLLGCERGEPSALSPSDVEILETGCMQLLPPDRQGRTVLFLSLLLLKPHMHHDAKGRLKVLWYLLHKGFTSGVPQAHRLVTVVLCVRPPKSGYDVSFGAGGIRAHAVLPLQGDAIHLLTLPAASGTGRLVQGIVGMCLNTLGSFFRHLVKVHHGATAAEMHAAAANASLEDRPGLDHDLDDDDTAPRQRLVQQLRPHGLCKRGLPESVGGLYTLQSFHKWIQAQRKSEKAWSSGGKGTSKGKRVNNDISDLSTIIKPKTKTPTPPAIATQRAQRRREINKMHSQRKRQRRRQEFEELQEQVRELEAANDEARKLQFDLQLLVDKASGFVQGLEAAGVPASNVETVTSAQSAQASGAFNVVNAEFPTSNQQDPDHDCSASALSSILAALEPDPIAPCLPGGAFKMHPVPPVQYSIAHPTVVSQAHSQGTTRMVPPMQQSFGSSGDADPRRRGSPFQAVGQYPVSPTSFQGLGAQQLYEFLQEQSFHRPTPCAPHPVPTVSKPSLHFVGDAPPPQTLSLAALSSSGMAFPAIHSADELLRAIPTTHFESVGTMGKGVEVTADRFVVPPLPRHSRGRHDNPEDDLEPAPWSTDDYSLVSGDSSKDHSGGGSSTSSCSVRPAEPPAALPVSQTMTPSFAWLDPLGPTSAAATTAAAAAPFLSWDAGALWESTVANMNTIDPDDDDDDDDDDAASELLDTDALIPLDAGFSWDLMA